VGLDRRHLWSGGASQQLIIQPSLMGRAECSREPLGLPGRERRKFPPYFQEIEVSPGAAEATDAVYRSPERAVFAAPRTKAEFLGEIGGLDFETIRNIFEIACQTTEQEGGRWPEDGQPVPLHIDRPRIMAEALDQGIFPNYNAETRFGERGMFVGFKRGLLRCHYRFLLRDGVVGRWDTLNLTGCSAEINS